MIENVKPMSPVPLGVLIDAAAPGIAVPRTAEGGDNSRADLEPLATPVDERFAVQVVAVVDADVTAALAAHPHWCGVLLSDRLRRSLEAVDSGWAAALNIDDALLPLEFIEHLRDEHANENFVARVLTCHAWRELQGAAFSLGDLQSFFARHKYLLMSRHIGSYQQVGQLLASPLPARALGIRGLDTLARQTIAAIMAALRRPATRGGHGNALAHVRGYLKNRLSGAEKAALDEALEWYRLGLVPLHTPLDLLRDYFARYPDPYIDQQVYMQPRVHTRLDPALLLDPLRGEDGRLHAMGER
jgi:uncharacterized protein YbgA (DUF1722 family)